MQDPSKLRLLHPTQWIQAEKTWLQIDRQISTYASDLCPVESFCYSSLKYLTEAPIPKFFLLAAVFPILWSTLKSHSKIIKAKIIALFFMTIGLGDFLCNQLKYIFSRLRPFDELSWFEKGFKLSFSFPSNHAFNWFVASTFLYLLYKNDLLKSPHLHRVVFIVALGISISRVLTGRHFPLDVMGGFVFGTLFAATAYMFMNKGLINVK